MTTGPEEHAVAGEEGGTAAVTGDGAGAAPGGGDTALLDTALLDTVRHRLAELDGAPVASHVAVYDEVHGSLQGALASLDEG